MESVGATNLNAIQNGFQRTAFPDHFRRIVPGFKFPPFDADDLLNAIQQAVSGTHCEKLFFAERLEQGSRSHHPQ